MVCLEYTHKPIPNSLCRHTRYHCKEHADNNAHCRRTPNLNRKLYRRKLRARTPLRKIRRDPRIARAEFPTHCKRYPRHRVARPLCDNRRRTLR